MCALAFPAMVLPGCSDSDEPAGGNGDKYTDGNLLSPPL